MGCWWVDWYRRGVWEDCRYTGFVFVDDLEGGWWLGAWADNLGTWAGGGGERKIGSGKVSWVGMGELLLMFKLGRNMTNMTNIQQKLRPCYAYALPMKDTMTLCLWSCFVPPPSSTVQSSSTRWRFVFHHSLSAAVSATILYYMSQSSPWHRTAWCLTSPKGLSILLKFFTWCNVLILLVNLLPILSQATSISPHNREIYLMSIPIPTTFSSPSLLLLN